MRNKLRWPIAEPRCSRPEESNFSGDRTLQASIKALAAELRRWPGTTQIDITCNNSTHQDKGVCAWFVRDERLQYLTSDKWHITAHNAWDIARSVRSFRMQALKTTPDGGVSIPLTKNLYAVVDTEDVDLVQKYSWYALVARSTWYAVTDIKRGGRRETLYMHRLLLSVGAGAEVDHKNRNGLDNRRQNLRAGTRSQNGANAHRPRVGKTSSFKGVSYDQKRAKWSANIGVNRKNIFLGYFDVESEAAEAYDAACRRYFKEFAAPNMTWRSWLNMSPRCTPSASEIKIAHTYLLKQVRRTNPDGSHPDEPFINNARDEAITAAILGGW